MAPDIKSHKVMIAGGCGYLGWRIIRWLIHEMQMEPSLLGVIDIASPPVERKEHGVEYFQLDITDANAVSQALERIRPEVIIHAASPPPSTLDLRILMCNNVEGTRHLIESAVAQKSVKAFIYISSSSVSHDTVSDAVEMTEEAPYVFFPEQRNAYSHSKAWAEQLALSYDGKRKDFAVAAVRPSVIFGPGERATVIDTVARAKRGSLRYQVGDGNNEFDFTYVDNVVTAVVLVANALLQAAGNQYTLPRDRKVEGEAFIITNDEHRKFWDFFRDVGAAAGYSTDRSKIQSLPKGVIIGIAVALEWLFWIFSFRTRTSPLRSADMIYSSIVRTFDISKAKSRLGYRPRFSIDEGIKLSVAPLIEDKKVK